MIINILKKRATNSLLLETHKHYMETRRKRKMTLREDARDFLKQNYPEAFEIKDIPVKVKIDKPFIKLMHINKAYYEFILKKLWFAYLGYFMVLLNEMNYDNQVDFKLLSFKWVSDSMIKVCKKKFIDAWMVRKHWWLFYIDPEIAIKWETINPNLKDIFKKEIWQK